MKGFLYTMDASSLTSLLNFLDKKRTLTCLGSPDEKFVEMVRVKITWYKDGINVVAKLYNTGFVMLDSDRSVET